MYDNSIISLYNKNMIKDPLIQKLVGLKYPAYQLLSPIDTTKGMK